VRKWERNLAGLAAYKATHGDCNVPARWDEDQPLSHWVAKQRLAMQGYTKALQVREPPSRPRSWANSSLLPLYSHRNAWANVVWANLTPFSLQRGEPYDRMTAARAAKLHALGFAGMSSKEAKDTERWEQNLARLAAYAAEHGDCDVPARWTEDPQLGNWVRVQRQCKKAMERGGPSQVRKTPSWPRSWSNFSLL
jgi:hypothetical protein